MSGKLGVVNELFNTHGPLSHGQVARRSASQGVPPGQGRERMARLRVYFPSDRINSQGMRYVREVGYGKRGIRCMHGSLVLIMIMAQL